MNFCKWRDTKCISPLALARYINVMNPPSQTGFILVLSVQTKMHEISIRCIP